MKLALLTFLAVAVCAVFAHPHPTELASGRIIGGVNALPGEFPQICLITWSFLTTTNNVCACAIVNHNHVVTAAHCITEAPTNGRLEVLGGVLDHTVIAPQRQRLGVLQTFIHPHFNAGGNGQPRRNDIAVVSGRRSFQKKVYIGLFPLPFRSACSLPSSGTPGSRLLLCPLPDPCPVEPRLSLDGVRPPLESSHLAPPSCRRSKRPLSSGRRAATP